MARMMCFRVFLGLVIGLFMSVSAAAAPGGWTPVAKPISDIIIDSSDSGRVLVMISGGVPKDYLPSACSEGVNSQYNTINLETEKGKAMYAMALAAYVSAKPIKLALSCIGPRPLITHLWF